MTEDVKDRRFVADAASNYCELVGHLIEDLNKFYSPVCGNTDRFRTRCQYQVWGRIGFWMRSLRKLKSTEDFQAVSTANRALFELMIDLALLSCGDEDSGRKSYYFGYSDLFRIVQSARLYYGNLEKKPPTRFAFKEITEELIATVGTNRAQIFESNSTKHPGRWTGNANLLEDAREADRLLGEQWVSGLLGMSFTDFYQTDYRMLSTFVHATSAGIETLDWPAITLVYGLNLYSCSDLAMLATRLMIERGPTVDPSADAMEKWARIAAAKAPMFEDYRRHFGEGDA